MPEITPYENTLSLYNGSRIKRLRQSLRHGLYHVTSPNGFRGIVETGAIFPNDGHFPHTYPQSIKSYATKRGAVALFDFESASDQHFVEYWYLCEDFFYHHAPLTYVLAIDRSQLPAMLITYEQALAELGFGTPKIAYLETWCPVPVPFGAITRVTIVRKLPIRYHTFRPEHPGLLNPEALADALWPTLSVRAARRR
jgi:hypothetical protein